MYIGNCLLHPPGAQRLLAPRISAGLAIQQDCIGLP
jgi:hypothetical protein